MNYYIVFYLNKINMNFKGQIIKDDIKCLYSMYNKSVFDAELSILNVFKDKLPPTKLSNKGWLMLIIDTFRIKYIKSNQTKFKVIDIANELENNFTEEFKLYMIKKKLNWRNSFNSYFTKSNLLIQLKEKNVKGYWMLYDMYYISYEKYFNKIKLDDNIISDKEQNLDDNIISNKRKLDDSIISDKKQNLDNDIFSNKNIKLFDENYRFTEIPLILPYISI